MSREKQRPSPRREDEERTFDLPDSSPALLVCRECGLPKKSKGAWCKNWRKHRDRRRK